MKGHNFLRLTLAALLFAAMTAALAPAQTIAAEDDTWTTGSGTQVDFSNFGNINLGQLLGSPPTSTVVNFAGTPLSSSLGQADTLVARGSVTVSDSFSATLSLKGLSLGSSPDLTLQDGRVYHITVTLATQGGGGQMDFTRTSSDGGTFNSSFVVTPIFTLTNVNNSNDGPYNINCLTDTTKSCSFTMHGSGDWVLTSSTGFDPQNHGIPTVPSGVTVGSYTTVGRPRYGGMQVGCNHTSCGQNDELHGIIGQAAGHNVSPPNDCASSASPSSPSPSPSPSPTSGTTKQATTSTSNASFTTQTDTLCAIAVAN
jgi:hypothetical protein